MMEQHIIGGIMNCPNDIIGIYYNEEFNDWTILIGGINLCSIFIVDNKIETSEGNCVESNSIKMSWNDLPEKYQVLIVEWDKYK